MDQQELINQLMQYLQSEPKLLEYLEVEPEGAAPFDPYQMVSEWIALRQELKQQGKVLQAAQDTLQRELEATRSQQERLQQQLEERQQQVSVQFANEFANQQKRVEKEQESLFKDLLAVMDALDQAVAYWQKQLESAPVEPPVSLAARLGQWLIQLGQGLAHSTAPTDTSIAAMIQSNQEGIELIRQNLLDTLQRFQIVPISAQGQPFNPQQMYAIARQDSDAIENTVVQEVVRGYLWRDQILREAQVIVSTGKKSTLADG